MINFINSLDQGALLDILLLSNEATAIYTTEDLHIELVNQGMLNIWGKEKFIRGMRLEDGVPELKGQPFLDILKNAYYSGEIYQANSTPAELEVDGKLQTFWFDFVYRPIKDANGKVTCILHTATEVSSRILAEQLAMEKQESEQRAYEELQTINEEYQTTNEELNAANEELNIANEHLKNLSDQLFVSQNQLAQLVSTSPVAMAILTGEELLIEMANDRMYTFWGRRPSLAIGKKMLEVFPELIDQPFPQIIKEVFSTGAPIEIKEIAIEITSIEGISNKYYVNLAYHPLPGHDGIIKKIMATVIDITQIVETRKLLEEAQKELNDLNTKLEAANEEYQTTYEDLVQLNEEFHVANEEIGQLNEEFQAANEELHKANEILHAAGLVSDKLNKDLTSNNVELLQRNILLSFKEKRALELFSDAPVAIGLLSGRDMNILSANSELLTLWGKKTDIIGKPLITALPELTEQSFPEILERVFNTGQQYYGKGEKVILERDGDLQECYFNYIYKPIKGITGPVHSIIVVANDVTDQIKANQSEKDISEKLSIALGAANLGSYDLELSSGKMECSDRCKLNFGRDINQEFNFPDLIQAILPQYREMVEEQFANSIHNNQIYQAEYEIQLPGSERNWIHASGSPRYNEDGVAVRMVGVTLNITERKIYEQRRDDFMSVAAHELKTPITVLKANLQLLDRIKLELGSIKAIKLIDSAGASMNKVNMLVEDLLNVSKHSGGRLQLNKNWFDIPKMLTLSCNHIRMEGRHELILSGESELKIFADEHRIEQVLVNFVNNAVKYAPGANNIHIIVERLDEYAKVSVKDFGPGIPKEQLSKLFERYWQADKSTRSYTGLGLGLSICSEIIERHGGKIGVESEVGNGSTFWFTLPL